MVTQARQDKIYAKEPADSARYEHLKFDFYRTRTGQLCERKLAMARGKDNADPLTFRRLCD